MRVCGVDENGLGPRLGPLVATAVTLELPSYERARLRRIGARVGIDDSKASAGFGQMATAEGLALAVLESLHGAAPRDADALLHQLALHGLSPLRARCPDAAGLQCWSARLELPAFGGELAEGRRALSRLVRHGVRVVHARSSIACVSKLREDVARRGSRTSVDLALFESLVLDARAAAGQDLEVILGMVGGIRDYPRYFEHLRDRAFETLPTDAGARRYRSAGLGTLSFEIDADARHLPVALASMIGKYVRELSMERQNRFYASHDAELPAPSGYHDPVTRRFVDQSRALRRRLGIVDACFER
jgi:ribonuclease HII